VFIDPVSLINKKKELELCAMQDFVDSDDNCAAVDMYKVREKERSKEDMLG